MSEMLDELAWFQVALLCRKMAAIFRCRETNETQKVEAIQQRVHLASLEKAFKAAEVKIYEEDDDDEPTSMAVDNNGFTCGQFVNKTTYDAYVEKAAGMPTKKSIPLA